MLMISLYDLPIGATYTLNINHNNDNIFIMYSVLS